ncbi:MAG: patatin-like phospholipase family protein [Bryobacteraceae bacterium]
MGTFSSWFSNARRWISDAGSRDEPRIGVALGGGFARGIAHIGVLRVLEAAKIPIHAIAGVSAGSIIAAAYASGATPTEIEAVALRMKFSDVARWTVNRMGLVDSRRMDSFLRRLLKAPHFEQMRVPLAVVASDLTTGKPMVFRGRGDVYLPIRASCAYPGLFLPIRHQEHWLVDGMISMEVPALPLRWMGATHVISVALPSPVETVNPHHMLAVINRCFQVLTARTEFEWRRYSNLVIAPDVSAVGWDSFGRTRELIEAGESAARAALPSIRRWLRRGTGAAA